MAEIKKFVPWNSNDADATIKQLEEWVRFHKEKGHDVGIVACLVTNEGNPDERFYQVSYTPLPVEVIEWAAREISQNIWHKKQDPT